MNAPPILALVLVSSCTLFAVACSKKDGAKPTDAPDAAAPIVTVPINTPAAASAQAAGIPAPSLKGFLPQDGAGGYKRVHRSTKDGYAEATLEKDGKEVAVLSITDAERMAYVKAKFENATEKADGYPLLTIGKDLSTILVKDRFQIKVLSKTLDADARKAIFATFDLKGLAGS